MSGEADQRAKAENLAELVMFVVLCVVVVWAFWS